MHFKTKSLPQSGFIHHLTLVALIFIVGVAIVGSYELVSSHAATAAYTFKSGIPGKCLDDYQQGTTNGTTVDSYACNGTTAQQWNTNTNGTIENANGKCLDNWQQKNTNGNPIKMYNCSATDPAEQWQLTNNTLKNPQTNKCLDDPAYSTTNGKPLELYTCNGGTNQQWVKTVVSTGTTTTTGTGGSGTGSGGSGGSSTSTGSSPTKGTTTAGNTKTNCIDIAAGSYGEVSLANVAATEKATGVTYNCLETFDNPVDNWTDWEAPWQFTNEPSKTTSGSWENWLATGHQMVLGVDLIPQSAPGSSNGTSSNPLEWEQACDAGNYNTYATQLAKNLVSYGASGIIIRLGIEANGSWEADFVGTSNTEMSDWAKCYDNEVTAMRAVSGANFQFVWNPNICTLDLALSGWYPGNAYVDIIGADAYDSDCHTSSLTTVSSEGWQAYSTDSSSYPGAGFPSLANIEAFAKANGKPMSFPEWGLTKGGPDDSTYVTDMGQMFNSDDFAFESYFDDGNDGIAQLGSTIPNATAAYTKEFK